MNIHNSHKLTVTFLLGIFLSVALMPAQAITPAQNPLSIGVSAVTPNIMLMVDNSGSMGGGPNYSDVGNSVPDTVMTPADKPNTYTANGSGSRNTFSCSSSNRIDGGATPPATPVTTINMKTSGSTVQFCSTSTCANLPANCSTSSRCGTGGRAACCTTINTTSDFGNDSGEKCFDNTKTYTVKYYNDSIFGTFSGLNLNWYFTEGFFSTGSLSSEKSRIVVARKAAIDLVDSLIPDVGAKTTVRLGLATYNNGAGGTLLSEIADLDADAVHATAIKTQIDALRADGSTPLAETLADIGRYFTIGEASSEELTLHPSTNPTPVAISSIFTNGSASHEINNQTGNSPLEVPIQNYCQKSFAILLSDGLPTSDTSLSSYLKNYHTPNGSYSSYLDDVAEALYDMNLRPTMPNRPSATDKSNLVTYAIGFADPDLSGDNVLKNATVVSGGQFFFADNVDTLADSFNKIIIDISSKVGSSSSVAANSSKLDNGSVIYQAKYDSADWSGSLSAFPIADSEDINGNGILDTEDTNHDGNLDSGEDANNNGTLDSEDTDSDGILDAGSIGTKAWNAAEHIPAHSSRNIYTYNTDTPATGAEFRCAYLTTGQKTALGISDCNNSTDHGVWRLNYLRGDVSHEQKNSLRKASDPDSLRSSDTTLAIFRNRTHFDKLTGNVLPPDPWVLGDIVNSDPVFVSNENFGYNRLPSSVPGRSDYKAFVTANAARRQMVYVGANDGMLHGFDATLSGADPSGNEILAYIPNAVYSKLSLLSTPGYSHQYFVDGSPRVADAYFNSAWHTVLVNTTGAGGKGVFALDITAPDSFLAGNGGANVLWDISDTNSPEPLDLTTDTAALRGFANNLGYTLPQASIVRMQDGSWVAVVANGYGSINNRAVLYIINIQTGAIIRTIDTNAGSALTPNGLSTPIAVDTDGDLTTDAIYAGDLLGNLWKFDVSSSTPSAWNVAYGGSPLFIACTDAGNCDNTRQPITNKPQVGKTGLSQSKHGVMVYFGTGKYFETTDNDVTNAQTQTLYGVWDNAAVVAKSDLQQQSILEEVTANGYNLRITTDTAVTYPTQKGWYMNLLTPPDTASDGERVVSAPLLRGGRIIFTTLTPIPETGIDVCGAGAEGTSWLMELSALTGSRFPGTDSGAQWDINGDGMIDDKDLILDKDGNKVAPSGKQSKVGSNDSPGVVTKGKLEYKYTSGSNDAAMEMTIERRPQDPTAIGGRVSWRQLMQ